MRAVQSLKICTLLISFCPKHIKSLMKKYRRVLSYDTQEWFKVWRKTDFGSKNDTKNLLNFNASSDKSENLHLDVLLLSIAYKVSAKKVQKYYLSWHWRVIQTLKKSWFIVWKMTWGIWSILKWAVKTQKICAAAFVKSV